MSKTATAEKPETASLDERIAQLLKSPNDQSSETFGVILAEISTAIAVAEREGREALARSVNPAILDPTARGKAHDAEFAIKRLNNAVTALTVHYQTALRREELVAWESEAGAVRQRTIDLAKELVSTYPPAVLKLCDLFKRISSADAEASSLNYRAPVGASTLRTVENSIGAGHKLIEKVQLPVLTAKGIENMWPPKNNWAVEYSESVNAAIVNAKPAPSELERAEEARRHIEQGEADEREHQRACHVWLGVGTERSTYASWAYPADSA